MTLDDRTLDAPLLDHTTLDLDEAERVTYLLDQRFHYTYDAPITSLRQRLVVVPPSRHGNQHRRAHRVDVAGARARRVWRRDRHGNTVVRLHADAVERAVEFRAGVLVERVRADGPTLLPASALRDPVLLRATRLTAPDERLKDLAASLAGVGDPVALADRICATVHTAIAYAHGVTSVMTTAAQALSGGRGVCQDSAHVMLALCHLVGLPARYVSGHLLGEGGTHCWVEVVVPSGDAAVAMPFDPCNGRPAGFGYVTVATGRDYADVAPTSGRYFGTPNNALVTSRRVGVLAAA
ncbi:MAG TPA: transglutaminase family protein [Pseudonocardiaceae bacterium]|jgi:transglutaminase-like putative cysteine protease|nr:transglutaminase family protein [Pseudonocardiaceae bacterium]